MRNIILYYIFHVLCLFSTACLIAKCIHQYLQDNDMSQVEYRKFHDMEGSIYPSVSLCFNCFGKDASWDFILADKIEQKIGLGLIHRITRRGVNKWRKKINSFLHHKYGKEFVQKLFLEAMRDPDLDYDEVTINLLEHLLEVTIVLQNEGQITWTVFEGALKLTQAFETIRQNLKQIKKNFTEDQISQPNITNIVTVSINYS